jgi:SSS family solute:Na+ symporter
MDFIHKLRPEINNKQLMSIGRLVTFIFMLLAVIWAPQIANFNSLFNYLQQILAYTVSPVVAIFILGLFWRGANANGAFIALISASIIGIILFLLNVVFEWTAIHFLYIAPILFIISLITAIIVSLMSKTPNIETDLIWTKEFYDAETRGLQNLAWYQNYRVLSVLLLSLTAWVVVSYW